MSWRDRLARWALEWCSDDLLRAELKRRRKRAQRLGVTQ